MNLNFERIPTRESTINICRNDGLIMGFTENGFAVGDLADTLQGRETVLLKQIHSNVIFPASKVVQGDEGDGLIVQEKGLVTVIKTADCVPLFFWNDERSIAGILHIGWKGLHLGIEQKLLEMLDQYSVRPHELNFLSGPAIESTCYEVGPDLFEQFAPKHYRQEIFTPKENQKFWLDIKKGITLSLIQSGISGSRIHHLPLCTYCLYPRFPSYRKNGKTGQRIYNFIMLT